MFGKQLSVFVFCTAAMAGCGGGSSDSGYQEPAQKPSWDQVAAVIQANCAPCHNGSKEPAFPSSAVFLASPAAEKLKAGAMPPPPRLISASDKATLLAYLGR